MSQGFTKKSFNGAGNGITDVFINGVKQASTSGTEIDFTVPSGVKNIRLSLVGVSTDGINPVLIRIGDSGGIETTGYLGANTRTGTGVSSDNATGAWQITDTNAASRVFHGDINLTLHDGATNTWVCSTMMGRSDGAACVFGAGSKSLSGELTTVQITSGGTPDDFDAGSINIMYDNPAPTTQSSTFTGIAVQTVNTQDGGVATGTTTIPLDDTVPQNTEGNEFITASITPKSTSNILKIDVVLHLAHSSATRPHIVACLFQDSTANALATTYIRQGEPTASIATKLVFTHYMTAGTVSATTFKVRAGAEDSGTITFNGQNATRLYGGTLASSITITEYRA